MNQGPTEQQPQAEAPLPPWLRALVAVWMRRRGGRRVPWSAVITSVLVHVGILLGAGYLTVLVVQGRQKVMFDAKQPPSIPARKLEHSIRVKQMQEQMRKPQILERLVAQAPTAVSLPELPKMEMPDQKNVRDTPVLNARAGSILGSLGASGGGAGRGLTGGGGYSDTKFFGENVRTRAICILMDISPSMVAKGVVEDVRRESITMLEGLSPVTKFDLVVFVDGAEAFAPQMVFATQENKAKAIEWLKQPFDGRRQGNRRGFSGSTPSEALRMAVDLGCDTMFVLTDDPPYLKEGNNETGVEIATHAADIEDYVRGIETKAGRSVRINTIVYKPHANERGQVGIVFYKKIAQATGGKFRLIKE